MLKSVLTLPPLRHQCNIRPTLRACSPLQYPGKCPPDRCQAALATLWVPPLLASELARRGCPCSQSWAQKSRHPQESAALFTRASLLIHEHGMSSCLLRYVSVFSTISYHFQSSKFYTSFVTLIPNYSLGCYCKQSCLNFIFSLLFAPEQKYNSFVYADLISCSLAVFFCDI